MSTTLDRFSEGLYSLANSELPAYVISEAKKCLLDYLGVTFAGAKELKEKSIKALSFSIENGNIPVIGLGQMTTLMNAILFNGIHSHTIELDDGHRYAMMHPGAPVISALLPYAIHKKISYKDLIKGIVLGYDASIRFAAAVQPSLKSKGFHATGIAGTIGAAVSIAVASRFTKNQLKNAVSAASTSASGILRVIKNISELKPYNVGNAAQSGYTAAMLAYAGFEGPYDVFDGELGFLKMMSDNTRKEYLTISEKDEFSIMSIYRKPYAACRHNHAPIEAALNLKRKHDIKTDEIQSVEIKTYDLAVSGHEHTDIVGINSAKMSIPYSVAVALINNSAGINEFDNAHIQNEQIIKLTKNVKTISDEELSKLVPTQRPAIATITMTDGSKFIERVDYPKGEPENPINKEELVEKFYSLSLYAGKTAKECEEIKGIIFDNESDITSLLEFF